MYVKKEDRQLTQEIDDYLNQIGYPEGFIEWINQYKYDLGLLNRNNCTCSYCKKIFETSSKINEYLYCPFCKKKLLLKRWNIKWYEKKEQFNLLQEYGNNYISRQFELTQNYNMYCNQNKIKRRFIEIGRQIIYKNGEVGTDYIRDIVRKNTAGYHYVAYWEKSKNWKPSFLYDLDTFYGRFYPNNLDEILKPQYIKLKEFADNVEAINICDVINNLNSNDYKFEMLIKAKLYNLALDSHNLGNNRKFIDVFELDKSYLPFMQKYNITFEELKWLQKLKIKDIDLLRYFDKFSYWDRDKLLSYCKPLDLYKYKLNPRNLHIYLDYLEFAKKLGFDITDKKYLYPKHLKQKHDKYMKQIETNKNKKINKEIKKRYKELLKNQYKDKKYIIFPAASIEELVDESSQQDNCVRTYAKRIAEGECDIYFMRLLEEPKKSLVTVEVRNNKVVQQRIKNNADTTKFQKEFLKQWEKKVLQVS